MVYGTHVFMLRWYGGYVNVKMICVFIWVFRSQSGVVVFNIQHVINLVWVVIVIVERLVSSRRFCKIDNWYA